MTRQIDNPAMVPTRLGEYHILRELAGSQSFEAIDSAARHVVLKRLSRDCMLGNALHPHVRDRLLRVRELAHPGVANLIGVEATALGSMLVWEFVQGRTIDEAAADLASAADLTRLAEEVLISVQSLHALGIVHGGIHGRNVILDARRSVRLTHISPLLYDDPRQDAHDVATLISAIATARGWDQPAWDKLPHDAEERGVAGMRRRLSRAIDNRPPSLNREVESRRSRRLVAGAVIAAAAGLAMAGGVIAYEIRARPPILAPPRIAPMAAPDQPSVQPDDASADNGSPELASPPQPDVPGSGGAN